MSDRALYGWRVTSELPLPELPEWAGDERPADIAIRLGKAPPIETDDAPHLRIARDGASRFEVEAAAYGVDAPGREIVVEPHIPLDAPEIRLFLFGTVFAIACFRRGLLPLHASCVRIGDRAVAFSGTSGAGKSTMAAAFLRRGYAILADDVAVIEPGAEGGPRLRPALPRLKLWQDMIDGFGMPSDGLERTHSRMEKFHLPIGDAFAAAPLALSAIYHLEETDDPEREDMRPLTGIDAFRATERAVYRHGFGLRLIGREALFRRAGQVATALRSVRLVRRKTLARADEIVERIAACEGARCG